MGWAPKILIQKFRTEAFKLVLHVRWLRLRFFCVFTDSRDIAK